MISNLFTDKKVYNDVLLGNIIRKEHPCIILDDKHSLVLDDKDYDITYLYLCLDDDLCNDYITITLSSGFLTKLPDMIALIKNFLVSNHLEFFGNNHRKSIVIDYERFAYSGEASLYNKLINLFIHDLYIS